MFNSAAKLIADIEMIISDKNILFILIFFFLTKKNNFFEWICELTNYLVKS